jgi:signal transduction histidine kinase
VVRQIKQNSRQVLENMSDIVWAINTSQVGAMTLEHKLKNYGYDLLNPLGITCHYALDPGVEKYLEQMMVRKNILLVIKEAMNNIAKYSGATECSIALQLRSGMLELTVRDNGIGLTEDNVRPGNGIFNMQQRIEVLGGAFELKSAAGIGTTLFCTIPLTSIRDIKISKHA